MKPKVSQRVPRDTEHLRVSSGSAIALGLVDGKLAAAPTTAYLMTYCANKCASNCSFCPQARESHGSVSMLARVFWPVYSTDTVLDAIEKSFRENRIGRVCLQALNYPEVFEHIVSLVRRIGRSCDVPVSVSCQPLETRNIRRLAEAGVERIGIPLDAATEGIFDKVKGVHALGPYRWQKQLELLGEAVTVFGKGRVTTHLIVGLGETEEEMVRIIQTCVDQSVIPALFAFTPVRGTKMEGLKQPPIQEYRRIQIARYLILFKQSAYERMRFDRRGHITSYGVGDDAVRRVVNEGEAFLTSGCPDCNRPYYNERPSGPMYNYPTKLKSKDLTDIEEQLLLEYDLHSRKIYVEDLR